MRWFRLYAEVLDDPKIQLLPVHTKWRWIELLCIAAQTGGTLPDVAHIAFRLRISTADAQATIDDLVLAGLIDIGADRALVMHNWAARQWQSDDSTERVRKHRLKKRNADVTVTVTPPDSDSETERNKSLATEQEPARDVKGVIRDAVTRGAGGAVSVESRRRVAQALNIADPTPLVEAYHRLRISRHAKNPDALFESQAERLWQRSRPEVRAACHPISAMADAPLVIAKPSSALLASLPRSSRHVAR